MAHSEQARRYAMDILERRRLASARESERRRDSAHQRIPELAEIDARIQAIGIGSVTAVLEKTEDAQELQHAMSAQIDELRARCAALLKANHLPSDTLEGSSVCSLCRDTGTAADGALCSCVKILMQNYARREIERTSPLELCDFSSFSLEYYPTSSNQESADLSPRDVMRENLEECRRFSRSFPCNGENLLMMGDSGLGKTHLALSIASEVLDTGFDVLYCSSANIFRQIESEQFGGNHDTTTLDRLKKCDLLILDDLGAEHNGPYLNSVLYDMINTRIHTRQSTVFTTNITSERALTARYGEKISSRLIGCSKVLPFLGDDIRLMKNA